jgi:hypothetical protein
MYRWITLAAGGSFLAAAIGYENKPPAELTIIITGNAEGDLSPCGCTKPMSGGLKRLGTFITQFHKPGRTLWVDTGNVAPKPGRQQELKWETYAEWLGASRVSALVLTRSDTQKPDTMPAISGFVKGKILSPSQSAILSAPVSSGLKSVCIETSADTRPSGKSQVSVAVLPSSDQKSAADLVVVRSEGAAFARGKVVSPGSGLRGFVVAKFRGKRLVSTTAYEVGHSVKHDPTATRAYNAYLARMKDEKLFERIVRTKLDEFAGTSTCGGCHSESLRVHQASLHSKAMASLKAEGHEKDPECVGCHSTGLDSFEGFSATKPELGEVSCESCHGPGTQHSALPNLKKMPKVGEKSCQTCHTSTTSPNFEFTKMWRKIQHK